MMMGVALLSAPIPVRARLAIAAVIFYIVHNMLVKTNLVPLSGVRSGDDRRPSVSPVSAAS
jgi:hypothetical protein